MTALIVAMPCRGETITVSAAISLKKSLEQIAGEYASATGDHIVFNFDASGKLAAQIKQGAPVDLFISADNEQMNSLVTAKIVGSSARRIVVQNALVLIVPADAKNPPSSFADLANHRNEKIAIGEPKSVPAGRYAMQTLTALSLDRAVAPMLVYGDSVRAVLTYVQRGEVCAGIVYATDAKQAGDKVRVVENAPALTHDPIEYPGAVIAISAHAASANQFLAYLSTEPATRVFRQHGFSIPSAATRPAAPSPILSDEVSPRMLSPLVFSLLISTVAVMLVALTGIGLSSFSATHHFLGKSIVEALFILPLVLPPTVVGYFLIVLLGAHGIFPGYSIVFRSEGAVLAAAVVFISTALPAGEGGVFRSRSRPARKCQADGGKWFSSISTCESSTGYAGNFKRVAARLRPRDRGIWCDHARARKYGEPSDTADVYLQSYNQWRSEKCRRRGVGAQPAVGGHPADLQPLSALIAQLNCPHVEVRSVGKRNAGKTPALVHKLHNLSNVLMEEQALADLLFSCAERSCYDAGKTFTRYD